MTSYQGLLFHAKPVEPTTPPAVQVPGQLDLLAEIEAVESETTETAFTWPTPVGAMWTADELQPGVMVLA